MDDSLSNTLLELGLMDFKDKLITLGVAEADDVLVLSDLDLGSVGLTIVQIRKLQEKAEKSEEVWQSPTEDAATPYHNSYSAPPLELSRASSACERKKSVFWRSQLNRPMRLIFIRHGESEANVDRDITRTVPDHMLHLTARGRQQALDAGRRLREIVQDESIKFIVSPYVRTRETFNGIKQGGSFNPNIKGRIDVRIREQEFGNYDSPDMKMLHKKKKEFGQFFFRFPDGESPADCFERASSFFETMYRSWEDNTDKNHVIVGHGMMILLMLMRLERWSVEEWERVESLQNCEFVVMERPPDDGKFRLSYTWCGGGEPKNRKGLRKREKGRVSVKLEDEIWDGNPDAPMFTNQPSEKAED